MGRHGIVVSSKARMARTLLLKSKSIPYKSRTFTRSYEVYIYKEGTTTRTISKRTKGLCCKKYIDIHFQIVECLTLYSYPIWSAHKLLEVEALQLLMEGNTILLRNTHSSAHHP